MIWTRSILSALALAGVSPALFAATVAPPTVSTLFSGEFDAVLRVAADHEGQRLSGYYDDGKCRFAFGGTLKPVLLYMSPNYGEAYEVEGWNPATPDRRFSLEIYSLARGGYQDLISLRLGSGDTPTTRKCRYRMTLDRANNVSNSFLAVRVVRKSHPQIYEILKDGGPLVLRPRSKARPAKDSAVWVAKTYSEASSPKGFVYLNWYPAEGLPQGGYIRERDLYALPAEAQ
jgi:hypothetical protein